MLTSSILTAALTIGGTAGAQYAGIVPAPTPAPAPSPDVPAPTPSPLSDFGAQVVAAFQQDNGKREQAARYGALFTALSQAIQRDGGKRITSSQDLGEAALASYELSGLARMSRVSACIAAALNEQARGPLDETKRAAVVRIFAQAGEALTRWGS
jgi:hypothetical protein